MFEHDYKNAMEKISPDAETRDKILDTIILKEEVKKRKNPAIPWRIAFACAACIAVVLGVVFVPRDGISLESKKGEGPTQIQNTAQVLTAAKTYDEIYELISKNKYQPKYETDADDFVLFEEAVPGSTSSSNTPVVDSAPPPTADNTNSVDKAPESEDNEFSNTTEQVEGVSEADIVKTDGKYIYYIIGTTLRIIKADGKNSSLLSVVELEKENTKHYGDMFLKDDRLIIMQTDYSCNDSNFVSLIIYDVSDPANPKQVAVTRQEGWYNSSRMVGDYIYLISECNIHTNDMNKDDPTTFVPTTEINGVFEAVPADSIYCFAEERYNARYTVVGAVNYKDGTMSDTASLLGGTSAVYCSKGNIILANVIYDYSEEKKEEPYVVEKTTISQLSISEGNIEYKASGTVDGTLENQFFIDEYNGYFRFVTTVRTAVEKRYKFENSDNEVVSYTTETSAALTVLDGALNKVGEIRDLAKGERVYSVRFMGDTAYFVTFRQTDPLFSADLSDPTNPKILGELKIPGFSEYMYPYGDGLLLGFGMDADEKTGRTTFLKLSMFDITDPANVTEQYKTIIENYNYSTALDDHKAMLVSVSKNLIGFVAHDNRGFQKYMIYEYTGDGFALKAQIAPPYENTDDYWKYWNDVRGLFVNDNFYVISHKGVQILSLDTFEELQIINF